MTVQRRIGPGEKQTYSVALRQGDVASFTVNQHSADTVSALFGPDGTALEESDCFEYGEDTLTVKIERTGLYRLEVRTAPQQTFYGTYTLRFARSGVSDRIPVEQLATRNKRLLQEGTPDSLGRALGQFDELLERWRSLGDRGAELRTLLQRADSLQSLARNEEALRVYDLALPISVALSDGRSEGEVWNGRGSAWWQMERPDLAMQSVEKALAIWAGTGDRYAEAAANSNAAVLYWSTGRWAEATRCGLRALRLIRLVGDRHGEAFALNNLAAVAESQGEYQKALGYLDRAVPLFDKLGDHRAHARALLIRGRIRVAMGKPAEALESYEPALREMRSTADTQWATRALSGLARIYSARGEYGKALDSAGAALAQARESRYRREEAEALEVTGEIQTAMGAPGAARESLLVALSIRQELGFPDTEAETLYWLARNEAAAENVAGAEAYVQRAMAITESLRSETSGELSRAAYLASKRDLYAFYIDLLMGQGRLEKALQVCEQARARSLLDMLSLRGGNISRGVPAALANRERELDRQLKFASRRMLQFIDGKQVAEQARERREIERVLSEYEEVEEQIRSGDPRFASLAHPQPFRVAEIQKEALDGDAVLVEYFLARDRSYAWAVRSRSLRGFTLPAGPQIEGAARHLYHLLSVRPPPGQVGSTPEIRAAVMALSRLAVFPVSAELARKKTILVAADGAMQLIPFALLSESGGGQPILLGHEVVNLPSASTLVLLRRQNAGRARPKGTLAVLADPVFERADGRVSQAARTQGPPVLPELAGLRLPRLIFSRREAEAISAQTPPGLTLKALDFNASRALAMSPELGKYRFVHLATHALVNSSHPEFSGLAFSMVDERGRPVDGFLSLHEIYGLSLPADLVTVSGCETGVGVDIRGEGMIGLTRGFIYSGAQRVAVSLWAVDDESTAELMKRFYAGFLGQAHLSVAAALRNAQLSLLREDRWNQPHAWAGFVLEGEYR